MRTVRSNFAIKGTTITCSRGESQFYGKSTDKGIEWRGFHMQGHEGFFDLRWFLNTIYSVLEQVASMKKFRTRVDYIEPDMKIGTPAIEYKRIYNKINLSPVNKILKRGSRTIMAKTDEIRTYRKAPFVYSQLYDSDIKGIINKIASEREYIEHPFLVGRTWGKQTSTQAFDSYHSKQDKTSCFRVLYLNRQVSRFDTVEMENWLVKKELDYV